MFRQKTERAAKSGQPEQLRLPLMPAGNKEKETISKPPGMGDIPLLEKIIDPDRVFHRFDVPKWAVGSARWILGELKKAEEGDGKPPEFSISSRALVQVLRGMDEAMEKNGFGDHRDAPEYRAFNFAYDMWKERIEKQWQPESLPLTEEKL